jgi:UDP-N-acetylglucosamine 2-epimerase (non-hydrolysing)
VYPIHPNPRVRETVRSILGGSSRPNIHLIEPLNYLPFVDIMSRATLILTDSGGVQEEAPSLGKRVIVLRETTERTEGLGSPFIRLTGCDSAKIVSATAAALTNDWPEPGTACDLYGDGHASRRILDALTSK